MQITYRIIIFIAFSLGALRAESTERFGYIDRVKLSSTGNVEFSIRTPTEDLEASCENVIQFPYTQNTLSEIYYQLLVAAKTINRRISFEYKQVGAAQDNLCELTKLSVLSEQN